VFDDDADCGIERVSRQVNGYSSADDSALRAYNTALRELDEQAETEQTA
jgi:hypothetical protein